MLYPPIYQLKLAIGVYAVDEECRVVIFFSILMTHIVIPTKMFDEIFSEEN